MLTSLQNDHSTESSVLKSLAFQDMNEARLQYFQTVNLCSEDTPLPLECLNTSNEYIVVWLHCGDNLKDYIEADSKTKLERVFHQIQIFNSMKSCLDFLRQLDVTTTRLFLMTSCFYDGMSMGTVSPLADRNSELGLTLRQFRFEHHVHGHASQWSSPTYIHTLGEIFIEAKFDEDALQLFHNPSFDPIYQVIWLRSTQNLQFEQRLRSVFSSIEIYDDQHACFNYVSAVDRTQTHIYLITDESDSTSEWKQIVQASYTVPSRNEDINRFVLKIRSDVRNEYGNPFHCIERSARRLTDRYAPFISLMAHLDLYVALSRNTRDRNQMKEEMLAACRIAYHNNEAYLKVIDHFDAEYDPAIKGTAIRWYTQDSFVYRLVNRVLRIGNPDFIYPYRYFINDLYAELLSIDRQDCEDFDNLIVYRGQSITPIELKYLQNYVGQLLTLSSFTSTTIDRDFALVFASARENMISILFEIHLNITLDNTRPFAYVGSYSVMPDELEVLVSMGTIFKLISVTYHSDKSIWIVILHLCQQHNQDIKNLMPLIQSKCRNFSNFQPIPFRRSSMPTINKFDGNLEQFNAMHFSQKTNIEKAVSLPGLLNDKIGRPITSTLSLRDSHDLSSEMIEYNMKLFQQELPERKRKRNMSISCPCLHDLNRVSVQRCLSLPILKIPSAIGLHFHILPRVLFDETVIAQRLDDQEEHEERLFFAGIYDILMIFNYTTEENADKSISLREHTDELRHKLRQVFNIQKGRWCAEY